MGDLWGEIGVAAGRVYSSLAGAKKQSTLAELKKKTKLTETMLAMGVGWLAREGQVSVDKNGAKIFVKLK